MKFTIQKRRLREEEAELLLQETRKFPHIGFINTHLWKTFAHTYVAQEGNTFVGVCAAFPLKTWVKLGPLVVREQFQGKGYGRALLTHVIKKYGTRPIFIGSSNPKVHRIIEPLGFRKEKTIRKVPVEVLMYLLSYLFSRWSKEYIVDALKKRIRHQRGRYFYFLRVPE